MEPPPPVLSPSATGSLSRRTGTQAGLTAVKAAAVTVPNLKTSTGAAISPKKVNVKGEEIKAFSFVEKMAPEGMKSHVETIPSGLLSLRFNSEFLEEPSGLLMLLKTKRVFPRIAAVSLDAPKHYPKPEAVKNLEALIRECNALKSLDFSDCKNLETKDLVSMMTQAEDRVEHLNLSGCSQLTDSELKQIARHLESGKLLTLNMTGCTGCTEKGFIHFFKTIGKHLQKLILAQCKVSDILLAELHKCVNRELKELSLNRCQNFNDNEGVTRKITLEGIRVVSKNLGGSLTGLDVGHCHFLTDSGQTEANIANELASILHDHFHNLRNIHEHKLRFLNIQGCPAWTENLWTTLINEFGQSLEVLDVQGIELSYEKFINLRKKLIRLDEFHFTPPKSGEILKTMPIENLRLFVSTVRKGMPMEHARIVCWRLLGFLDPLPRAYARDVYAWAKQFSIPDLENLELQDLFGGEQNQVEASEEEWERSKLRMRKIIQTSVETASIARPLQDPVMTAPHVLQRAESSNMPEPKLTAVDTPPTPVALAPAKTEDESRKAISASNPKEVAQVVSDPVPILKEKAPEVIPFNPQDALKHKEKRIVLTLSPELMRASAFEGFLKSLKHQGDSRFSLKVDAAALEVLNDPIVAKLVENLPGTDKLIYSSASGPLTPTAGGNLNLLIAKFTSIVRLSLAKCEPLQDRRELVKAFGSLRELNMSHIPMEFDELAALLEACPLLEVLHGKFSFSPEALECAYPGMLLRIMGLSKMELSLPSAQKILEIVLRQNRTLSSMQRMICIRWCLRYSLAPLFQSCLHLSSDSEASLLVAESMDHIIIHVPNRNPDSPEWLEAEHILEDLVQRGLFKGRFSLEVEGGIGSMHEKWLDRVLAILRDRLKSFSVEGSQPVTVSTPLMRFTCRCPGLVALKLARVYMDPEDVQRLKSGCPQLASFHFLECTLSDRFARLFLSSFPTVARLEVTRCSGLTPEGYGHLQRIEATESKQIDLPHQSREEALNDWTTDELLKFISSEEDVEACIRIIVNRKDVTLPSIPRLFGYCRNDELTFQACCRKVNDLCIGWFRYCIDSNEGIICFDQQYFPGGLSRDQIHAFNEICLELVARKATFILEAYSFSESWRKIIQDICTPIQGSFKSVAFHMLGSEAQRFYLTGFNNVEQITFDKCPEMHHRDLLAARELCPSLKQIVLQQCLSVSLNGIAQAICFNRRAIEIECLENERLDDDLSQLNNRELIELVRLFKKSGKTYLLSYIFEVLPIVPDRFSDLWAEVDRIPELRSPCMEAFNKAFNRWVEWQERDKFVFSCAPPHDSPEEFQAFLSCLKVFANPKNALHIILRPENPISENQKSLPDIFEAIGIFVSTLVVSHFKSQEDRSGVVAAMKMCSRLDSLSVVSCEIKGSDLWSVAETSPHLTSLCLASSPHITFEDMNRLVKAWTPTLRSLSVRGYPALKDATLGNIVNEALIERLDLTGCKNLTDEALPLLAKCPRLATLILEDCQAIALRPMSPFSQPFSVLRTLNLANCPEVMKGLSSFAEKAPELRSLNLTGNPHINTASVFSLANFRRLQELILNSCINLTPEDVENIAEFWQEGLTVIDLESCPKLYAMTETTLKRLVNGTSPSCTIRVSGYPQIPVSLAKLLSSGNRRDAKEIAGCENLTNDSLQILSILYHPEIFTLEDSRVNLEQIECLLMIWNKLKSLRVVGLPLRHDGATDKIVDSAKGLEQLSFGKCTPLTDRSLEKIATYGTQLRALTLEQGEQFTDRGLAAILESCPNLECFHLTSCTKITLKELTATCTGLRRLSLEGCRGVTDENLLPLVRQLPRLETLNLRNCSVTIKGLKRVIIDCKSLLALHVNDPKLLLQTMRSFDIAANKELMRFLHDSQIPPQPINRLDSRQ